MQQNILIFRKYHFIDMCTPQVVEVDDSDDNDSEFYSTTCTSPSQDERRVLQPLSPQEVLSRSPQVPSKGKVVKEELLISPDPRSPLLGLEQSKHRHILQGANSNGAASPVKVKMEELNSPTSSPVKNLANFSPIMKRSPKTPAHLPHLSKPQSGGMVSSTPTLSKSPTNTSTDVIMIDDTPLSSKPDAGETSTDILDTSSACRKLAFSGGSPASALIKTEAEDLNSPMAKKSKGFSPLIRKSPLITKESPRRKSIQNRRRSVCTKRCVSPDDDFTKSRSSEDENKENDLSRESDMVNDTAEESIIRNTKRSVRNRIISESDSGSASAFDVEETEDEMDYKGKPKPHVLPSYDILKGLCYLYG